MCAIDICIYHLSLTIRCSLSISKVVDSHIGFGICCSGLYTSIITLVITNLLEVSA